MNQFIQYPRWLYLTITILVLASLICANGMNYFLRSAGCDIELYELHDPLENESENVKEDIDLKLKNQHLSLLHFYSNDLKCHFETTDYQSICSKDTPTPPPEPFLVLLYQFFRLTT